MKLVISRDALVAGISRVARCVGRGSTIPIVGNLKLEAREEALHLSGTDLDVVATARVAGRVSAEGALTVPAKPFQDVVTRSPAGAEIGLDVDDTGRLVMKSGKSRVTLATLPAGEFPNALGAVKDAPDVTAFVMPANALAALVGGVAYAISSEEARFYLCGVFLHADEAELVAVATDGHRLARRGVPLPMGADRLAAEGAGIIVPTKICGEIVRLGRDAGEGEALVRASRAKIEVAFHDGATRIVSKLIDGTYPDYRRVIPADGRVRAKIEREALIDAVGRVSAVSGQGAIKLSIEDGRAIVSLVNPDLGEAMDEVEADLDGGEAGHVGFGPAYLRDTLQVLDGATVEMNFHDPGSPVIFRPKGDATTTLIVMPMRV